MTFAVADRIKETSSIVGTGTVTLLGAQTGYISFSTIGDGNTTYYCISDQVGNNWEVGIGTYTASGTTLARTTVLSNSLGTTALISFTSGTKDVFCTYPASTSVSLNTNINRHSIRPSLLLDFANTRQLDPRITFARASTATYYDGKTTAMTEQNLLTYSEQFDNAIWSKVGISVTANSIASPDGTTTAETMTGDGTTALHSVRQSVTTTGAHTYSIYAKVGTNNFIQILNDGTSTYYANFDLSTGTAYPNGAGCTASMVNMGNGWYRCIVSNTVGFAGTMRIALVTATSSAFGESNTLTTTAYLWAAQVENRSAVTAYIPTTTAPITNYIPALQTAASGVARFDCNPTTSESLGLLIEEQRTNLQIYSTLLNWTVTQSSSNSSANIAPDGTQVALKLIENTANNSHAIYYNSSLSILGSSKYTYSIYAKASERSFLALQINEGISTVASWVSFNLINGTVGTVTTLAGGGLASVTASSTLIGNGWYRCTLTWTSNSASTTAQAYIGTALDATTRSYTGDGYSGIYLWGAQLEAGSFATSYIPTVASQVTRVPDDAKITGANFTSWYNQSQGTVYVSAIAPPVASCGLVSINDTTNSNRMTAQSLSPTSMLYRYVSSSGNFASSGTTYTANSTIKTAFVYKQNDQAGYTNTIADTGITNQPSLPIVTQMQIGLGPSVLYAAVPISKIAYYPKRLTNAELQGLTS